MVKVILVCFLALVVMGCSAKSQFGQADTGGAIYNYSHTDEGKSCVINGTSAREVEGVEIEIGADCTMKITTITTTPATDALGVIGGLVDRLPLVTLP